MTDIFNIETFGFLASIIIAISFTMRSEQRLRLVNLFGGVLFGIYAYQIQATPVLLLNIFIAGVNITYLIRLSQQNNATHAPTLSSG